jgi:hypothetical protein
MSETLIRHNENGRRIVPANILVGRTMLRTRMLAGTVIFSREYAEERRGRFRVPALCQVTYQ